MKKLAAILIAMIYLPAYAQRIGGISGRVQDEQGRPMPDVIVTVLNGDRTITSSTTDTAGNYRVRPLKPGQYTVRISERFHETRTIDKFPVPANKFVILDMTMAPPGAATSEDIKIIGGRHVHSYNYVVDTMGR
jgi:hypothetical protein